jgi:hypothetical protein
MQKTTDRTGRPIPLEKLVAQLDAKTPSSLGKLWNTASRCLSSATGMVVGTASLSCSHESAVRARADVLQKLNPKLTAKQAYEQAEDDLRPWDHEVIKGVLDVLSPEVAPTLKELRGTLEAVQQCIFTEAASGIRDLSAWSWAKIRHGGSPTPAQLDFERRLPILQQLNKLLSKDKQLTEEQLRSVARAQWAQIEKKGGA